MNDFPNYKKATNKAYEILLSLGYVELPINIFAIVNSLPYIVLKKYSDVAKRFDMSFNEFLEYAPSEYGFIMRKGSKSEIYYNDRKDDTTNRFTIAHELGHCILEHTKENEISKKEANCFARNILCPIPIIQQLHLSTSLDYMSVFNISAPMANASTNVKKLDYYYIENFLYNNLSDLFYNYMTGYSLENLYSLQTMSY